MDSVLLKKLLSANKITAYRLSKETGVSESSISKLLNNKTDIKGISVGTLYKISQYFNVPMEYFLKPDDTDDDNVSLREIPHVPESYRSIFWDTDFDSLDSYRHRVFIITRMYCKGGQKGIRWIEQNYDEKDIIAAAKMSRNLNPIVANHLKNKYHLREDEMNFYKILNDLGPAMTLFCR